MIRLTPTHRIVTQRQERNPVPRSSSGVMSLPFNN